MKRPMRRRPGFGKALRRGAELATRHARWVTLRSQAKKAGIPVHEAWHDFDVFCAWLGNHRLKADEKQIFRKDTSLGWTPDNCVVSAWRKYHPKAVRVRCIETGREFPTILEASEHSGYSPAHLGRLAKAGKGWVLV